MSHTPLTQNAPAAAMVCTHNLILADMRNLGCTILPNSSMNDIPAINREPTKKPKKGDHRTQNCVSGTSNAISTKIMITRGTPCNVGTLGLGGTSRHGLSSICRCCVPIHTDRIAKSTPSKTRIHSIMIFA